MTGRILAAAAAALLTMGGRADGETLLRPGDWSSARGGARAEGRELVLPTPKAAVSHVWRLRPEWRVLRLRGAMRVTDVPKGREPWRTGRFAMEWRDARGRTVTPWPSNPGWTGTTGWNEVDERLVVPTNAAQLALSLCNLSTGGEVRFRDVSMTVARCRADRPGNAPLPPGVTDPESLEGAWTATSATRTRLSLNGVWRCRPALRGEPSGAVPGADDNWGWARLPDVWLRWRKPFAAAETLAPWFEDHPADRARILPDRAWYGRTFTMPPSAAGRRVELVCDQVASHATVYLDGRRAGAVSFPGGSVDLTPFVRPGTAQTLALDVTAHAEGDTLDYNEATRADRRRRDVKCPGVTGDVWLDLAPQGARILFAYAETSVARGEATFVAETAGLAPGTACRLSAAVEPPGGGAPRTFAGTGTAGPDGRVAFTAPWPDAARWDAHTPHNRHRCRLTLADATGRTLDETVPFTVGFREVAVSGRDLLLNGTPVHLRALFDRTYTQAGPQAAFTNAVRACRAAQTLGFNAFIAGNYSFSAGDTPYLQGMLDAADETGMLYCFTLPHFKDYPDLETPAGAARYRADTAAILWLARRHPSVVLWATSHNAAGYLGAGHPQRIDGRYELPAYADGPNRRRARLCRKIIGELDPTRPCYHHESGNLDDFHTVNCYLDWAPVQERSEWLRHWSETGVKPLFFVEWGLPHISNWSSYRGPLFIWRKPGYQSLWSAEYAAAYRGDAAYEATPEIRAALDREEELWCRPAAFHWSGLTGACRAITNNYLGVQARFAADNWRAMRAWGITAALPWDQEGLFARVPGTETETRRRTLADVRKEPGYAPAAHVSAWGEVPGFSPTALGETFRRWNGADCAWIGGEGVFTDKRHIYAPGARVAKQLVVLNDRRTPQTVRWTATFAGETHRGDVHLKPGARAFVPVAWTAPATACTARVEAAFTFAGGRVQRDAFAVHVLAARAEPKANVALYDPVGATAAAFDRLGVAYARLAEATPPDRAARVVVGRGALTPAVFDGLVREHARRGGRVVVFEQDKAALEAVGFRTQTLGLRHVFPRYRADWLADLLAPELVRDWAGRSTLVPEFTPLQNLEVRPGTELFAGAFQATRVWRNGNRGAVATVVPEKPSYGDWRALLDGGFDLQYAPLLEWRILDGSVVFCQMDVTARTEADQAADALVRRLACAAPSASDGRGATAKPYGMQAYMAGLAPRGDWFIEQDPDKDTGRLYLVSGGAGRPPADFFEKVRAGATALLLGLNAEETRAWSPVPLAVADTNRCHYTRIERLPPELNGLSNADWAWHGAMDFAAFRDAAPDGNVAFRVVRHGRGRLVFWQVPPWKIDAEARPYLRTSKRRAEAMLSRLMGNLGFRRGLDRVLYADVPRAEDDPYRYFHW